MQRSLCSHRHNKNEEEVDATKFTVGKRKLFFPSLRSVIYSVVWNAGVMKQNFLVKVAKKK